jgi:hypothetical protein
MTNGAADLTRPLCPYPLHARFRGGGDPEQAASFVLVTALLGLRELAN